MKNTIFTLLLYLSSFIIVNAQNVCTQTLRQARTIYDEGRIHELPDLLKNCLKDGFSDEEKTEAYRLLILSHIFLDEPDNADEAMLQLLRHNTQFQINPNVDPAEFINLYNTFRTKPIFQWGPIGGVNYTLANVINSYGVHDLTLTEDDATPSYGEYKPNIGFTMGLAVQKELFANFTARGEFHYSIVNFTYSNNPPTALGFFDHFEDFGKQSWAGLNLTGQYQVLDKSIKPYVKLGGSAQYLISDEWQMNTQISGGETPSGPDEDLKSFRYNFNYSLIAGAGISQKAGKFTITFDITYQYGLINITEENYDNGRLSTYYGRALNDISLNSINARFGVLIPMYDPKKLTK